MWESARLLRWLGLTILLIVAAAMPGAAFAHSGPHPDTRAAITMAPTAKAMKAGALQTSQSLNRCDREICCEAPGAGCCHSALGTPLATTLTQASRTTLAVPCSDPAPKSRKTETRPKPPRVSA